MKDPTNRKPSGEQRDERRIADDSEFSIDDESIAEEAPSTEAQRLEAERRLLEYEANPERCSTWEEVKRRLQSKWSAGSGLPGGAFDLSNEFGEFELITPYRVS